MLQSRLLESKMVTLQRHGLLATYAGSSGQEALYVVIGHLLDKDDTHVPYYRDQPCMLMRGHKPLDLIRYWSGNELGNSVPQNDLPICVPIATQCLHAVGVAYAHKFKQSKNIVIVTLGDGATSKGDFYEALNFASLYDLPIVFVINDNGWAISTPLSKQTKDQDLTKKAQAVSMESIQMDGTDLFSCIDGLSKAIRLARSSKPVLVHAKTIRLCDHTTADDAKRYKSQSLINDELNHDPIVKLKKILESKYHWQPSQDQALKDTLNKAIDHDVELFRKDRIKDPQTMFEDCYETMPNSLKNQQKKFKEYETN
ncbi:MAG: thiamine pyrophosphate-dependent enzyme [Pseudomonadota bacterium]|nr:thiamine pyrophosphate-dependent enzyme [Pseudomonadota bacterium]